VAAAEVAAVEAAVAAEAVAVEVVEAEIGLGVLASHVDAKKSQASQDASWIARG
jgi:hypothetical protein